MAKGNYTLAHIGVLQKGVYIICMRKYQQAVPTFFWARYQVCAVCIGCGTGAVKLICPDSYNFVLHPLVWLSPEL